LNRRKVDFDTIAAYSVGLVFIWPWLWLGLGFYVFPKEYIWIFVTIFAAPFALGFVCAFAFLASTPSEEEFAGFAFIATVFAAAAYGWTAILSCPALLFALRWIGKRMEKSV
jgi:hypothetical protein